MSLQTASKLVAFMGLEPQQQHLPSMGPMGVRSLSQELRSQELGAVQCLDHWPAATLGRVCASRVYFKAPTRGYGGTRRDSVLLLILWLSFCLFISVSLYFSLFFQLSLQLFFLYVVLKTSLFFREGGYCFFLSYFPLIFIYMLLVKLWASVSLSVNKV